VPRASIGLHGLGGEVGCGPAGCEHELRHAVIGLAEFLFFATSAVISNVLANKTTSWWTTAILGAFALLALPVVGDYFAARHEVSEEGLRYGRVNRRRGFRWFVTTLSARSGPR